jgi:hypothetical protein
MKQAPVLDSAPHNATAIAAPVAAFGMLRVSAFLIVRRAPRASRCSAHLDLRRKVHSARERDLDDLTYIELCLTPTDESP